MPDGPLFPELKDGGDQGSQDAGADITGLILPDLSDSVGQGSSVSSVPTTVLEGAEAPKAPDDPNVVSGEIPQPQNRRARNAAERIAQLTRRYHQEEQARSGAEAQLARVTALLEAQQNEIRALRQAPAQAQGLNGEAPAPVPVTPDSIRSIVGEVIQDYDSKVRAQNQRIAQMNTSHDQSFAAAQEEWPELGDRRTRARQLFDQLYSQSPLRELPDGPYQIALQVRGILADESVTRPAPHSPLSAGERKVQAAAFAPQQSINEIPNGGRAALVKEYGELMNRMRAGDTEASTYVRLRKVRAQLQGN